MQTNAVRVFGGGGASEAIMDVLRVHVNSLAMATYVASALALRSASMLASIIQGTTSRVGHITCSWDQLNNAHTGKCISHAIIAIGWLSSFIVGNYRAFKTIMLDTDVTTATTLTYAISQLLHSFIHCYTCSSST